MVRFDASSPPASARGQGGPAALLCPFCRFNELRRFRMAGKPADGRGCFHHVAGFPTMTWYTLYQREPGTDDE